MPLIGIAISIARMVGGASGISTPSNDFDFQNAGNYQFMDGDNYEFN